MTTSAKTKVSASETLAHQVRAAVSIPARSHSQSRKALARSVSEPARPVPLASEGSGARSPQQLLDYQRDVLERTILFWDTLRERANNMLEHERNGLPPLLDFEYETLLDARRFGQPANYALLRITQIGEDCWDDCVDLAKPPVIVIDPRAGHGPGIGGFKHDSEVGMAMHEGHPVYFVIFFPQPAPAQTLADVLQALRRFVEEVARRHPGKPPVLYGNCQAGWAVTLLSADCEGLVGPAVLNGSPLSYWAGESGVNTMRIAGGLLGGAWLAHMTADLGNGRFDGAWLAQNFENLKPEKAIWEKYADLFARVDSELERFLEFERWWNGYYFLSREEILSIVENLFIGNQQEQGLMRVCDGCTADLRQIRNPLVIFASYGDNITPPHQALGWIPAVYRDTDELKQAGQRIVYLTNPDVGHLGIIVSASIARLEHRAILESLGDIEALAPGLYEMKIDNPTGDPDCHKPSYSVRLEARKVEDLRKPYPREAFERVKQVSQINEALYRTWFSPWVQTMATPWTAVEYCVYQARLHLAALTAALGGLDRLVLTGGIGANATAIQAKVCTRLEYLGIALDSQRNAGGEQLISTDNSRVAVEAFSTDEEKMIAEHVLHALATRSKAREFGP